MELIDLDLLSNIVSSLDIIPLRNVFIVCGKYYEYSHNDILWIQLFNRKLGKIPNYLQNTNYRNLYEGILYIQNSNSGNIYNDMSTVAEYINYITLNKYMKIIYSKRIELIKSIYERDYLDSLRYTIKENLSCLIDISILDVLTFIDNILSENNCCRYLNVVKVLLESCKMAINYGKIINTCITTYINSDIPSFRNNFNEELLDIILEFYLNHMKNINQSIKYPLHYTTIELYNENYNLLLENMGLYIEIWRSVDVPNYIIEKIII